MAGSDILDQHKATIETHLQESTARGVPLSEVHQELLEVFQQKGKYSINQISAFTSWLRSPLLQAKRTSEQSWKEVRDSNEDVSFDNPPKNEARDWMANNFLLHTTQEQRRNMSLLLLPGQNTYDYQAFGKNLEIPSAKFVTYIKGDVPHANAQYIRNARDWNIENRRIGSIEKMLQHEVQQVRGAYLDFFGQFCFSYQQVAQTIPVDPNCDHLCIGFNILEGREHEDTSYALQAMHEMTKNMLDIDYDSDDEAQTELMRRYRRKEIQSNMELADIRPATVARALFTAVGIARPENWLLDESIVRFVQSLGKNQNFKDLPPLKKFGIFHSMLLQSISLFDNLSVKAEKAGVDFDMRTFGEAVSIAVTNSPFIRHLEQPRKYISDHKSRPFISYFGVLQTKRDDYMHHAYAMKFYFDVVTASLESAVKGKSNLNYFVKKEGGRDRLEFYVDKKFIAKAWLDDLRQATFDLSAAVDTYENSVFFDRPEEEIREARLQQTIGHAAKHIQKKIEAATKKLSKEAEDQKMLSKMMPNGMLRSLPRAGRNDPCPCGSGHKFKKCCLQKE